MIFSCGDKKEENKKPKTQLLMEYHNDETTMSIDPKVVYLKSNNKVVTGIIYDNYENGQLIFENSRKDGRAHGLSRFWYENGQLQYEANYKDGKEDGLLRAWYENGQLMVKSNAKSGKKISQECWDEEGNEIDCE
tara:strand:- start:88 stop:492 length:405 start_codon:yes stop_codon:yes gene_type:complete